MSGTHFETTNGGDVASQGQLQLRCGEIPNLYIYQCRYNPRMTSFQSRVLPGEIRTLTYDNMVRLVSRSKEADQPINSAYLDQSISTTCGKPLIFWLDSDAPYPAVMARNDLKETKIHSHTSHEQKA